MPNTNTGEKERKCGFCLFFKKKAVCVIEATLVVTKRYLVCEKHKIQFIEKNTEDGFRNPSFTPTLEFKNIEEYDA